MSRTFKKQPDFEAKLVRYAQMYCKNRWTLRKLSSAVGVPKTTLHSGFQKYLYNIDMSLYTEVMDLMEYNKSVAHIRGGNALKSKFHK